MMRSLGSCTSSMCGRWHRYKAFGEQLREDREQLRLEGP